MAIIEVRLIDAVRRSLITSDEEATWRALGYTDSDKIRIDVSTESFDMGMRLVERDTNSWVEVEFKFDGSGSEIADAVQDVKIAPCSGTIKSWTVVSVDGTSGSIVLDVWKDTLTNYRPTIADTITASAKPTITTDTDATSSTLTGWTTSVTKGDVFVANVDSCTSIKLCKLILLIEPRTQYVVW